MPNPEQIRQTIDGRLAVLWTNIRNRQAIFLAAKGRYFQGIRTPAIKPMDGDESATNSALRPTDQSETWADSGIALDAALPMTIGVDVYAGTFGSGYVACVEVTLAGRTWSRFQNFGPETWRNRVWHQVD